VFPVLLDHQDLLVYLVHPELPVSLVVKVLLVHPVRTVPLDLPVFLDLSDRLVLLVEDCQAHLVLLELLAKTVPVGTPAHRAKMDSMAFLDQRVNLEHQAALEHLDSEVSQELEDSMDLLEPLELLEKRDFQELLDSLVHPDLQDL